MTTSRCYQLQSVLIIFMLITINFVTSTDVSAVIHLILTGISVPFGLVFRRDRIVQTCDHSYVIIAIMLRITYCLSQSCVEYSLVTEFRKEIVRNERESSIQKGILFLEFFINRFLIRISRIIYISRCLSLVSINPKIQYLIFYLILCR